MRKIVYLLVFGFIISMYGCVAFHNGQYFSTTQLNTNNFDYVSTNAEGIASVGYFLGLGGMKRSSLIGEAKKDLLMKNKLRRNQALANVTVNFKTSSVLGIYIQMKCVMTADIVEFYNSENVSKSIGTNLNVTKKELFQQQEIKGIETNLDTLNKKEVSKLNTNNPVPNMRKFSVGDKVIFKTPMMIKGYEKDVQVVNANVIEIKGDILVISYKYDGKFGTVEKNQTEVYPKQ